MMKGGGERRYDQKKKEKKRKGAAAFRVPSEVFQPEPTPRNASVSFQRSRIMLPP
jgi:hypothetical protein